MNKISLVTRRHDRQFGIPTLASERAMSRLSQETQISTFSAPADESRQYPPVTEGGPAPQISIQGEHGTTLVNIVSEYLAGNETIELPARLSLEKSETYTGINIQFMPATPVKMLSTRQLAAMLGISTGTVYSLTTKGHINGCKVGRFWRFIWDEVVNNLKSAAIIRKHAIV